jgi:hypothetical protein
MKRQAFGASVSLATSEEAVEGLLSQSRGMDGRSCLPRDIGRWLGGIEPQLPEQFWVHDDAASREAARRLGVAGFMRRDRIFLGEGLAEERERVLRHELAHLAQVQLALRIGSVASPEAVEMEADALSSAVIASPVRYGADPQQLHPFIWFVAIGVGLYVLLRPSVANAPGPGDVPVPSPSIGQIVAESLCIFVVPGGAIGIGGKLGLGFLGRSALAGASTTLGLRVTDDVARGQASSPLMYLTDITTGAVIGFVVPGGVRLIGQAGTYAFDRLATFGLTKSDIALTKTLAEAAAKTPLTAVEARQILQSRGMLGQVSHWWLNRRGVIVLYRGQELATSSILSPLARRENVAASEALVARLRAMGVDDVDIASWTARYHDAPIRPDAAPPGMAGERLGSVGIPTSRIPGIASNFGRGVVYVIRVPKSLAIRPVPWPPLAIEDEYVILNQVPPGGVVQAIPAERIAPLVVDGDGFLVPGR